MDIDGWLREIGLAEYAEMFRANDIGIERIEIPTSGGVDDALVLGLAVVPFAIVAPHGLWASVSDQASRPLHHPAARRLVSSLYIRPRPLRSFADSLSTALPPRGDNAKCPRRNWRAARWN